MLGTRTKQVYSYGRRGHRIVNASDDRTSLSSHVDPPASRYTRPSSSSSDSESEPTDANRLCTPNSGVKRLQADASRLDTMKRNKSLAGKTARGLKTSIARPSPPRKPLSAVSANVLSSRSTRRSSSSVMEHKKVKPVIVGRGTPPRTKRPKLVSPKVDVEIIVLDDHGTPISQERRVSRNDAHMDANPVPSRLSLGKLPKSKTSGKPIQDVIILSSDDDDEVPPRRATKAAGTVKPSVPAKRTKLHTRAIVLSDDESIDTPVRDTPPPRPCKSTKHRNNIVLSPPESPDNAKLVAPTQKPKPSQPLASVHGPPPYRPYKNAIHFSPLVLFKARRDSRVLTPYRSSVARPLFPAPLFPTQVAVDVDDDLSLDLSQLSLSPATLDQLGEPYGSIDTAREKSVPAYLRPLLDACSQTTPHEFSAFIEMFPFDPIVQTSHGGVGLKPMAGSQPATKTKAYFQKIGEASFSEVFGIGDVVLKVIPLRDEATSRAGIVVDDADGPAPSDAKDVLREIIVTRAMGEMCEGFVQLLRTYVVRGKYPSVLLDLWDEYDNRKGSEGVRPDTFAVAQLYAIIVLPNGGPDLETFAFSTGTKNAWAQACSLFWQVTRALTEAEDLVQFEHRDLHWGQILVKKVTDAAPPRVARGHKVSMDHDMHGVRATVIDLGLSRMQSSEADGVHFTTPDEEVFEGEGEYQFDVYRMMRRHNRNAWKAYRPLTNVMWLHYLVLQLLRAKRLRVPMLPRKTPAARSAMFTERECYQCLVDVENVLRDAVASCAPAQKKARKRTQTADAALVVGGPACAADVLEMGVTQGWVC